MAGAVGAFHGHHATDIPLQCAGTVLILLRTLLVVVIYQRHLIAGLLEGSAHGIASARSLPTIYSACVTEVDGATLMAPAAIADALVIQAEGKQLTGMPDDGARRGTGFQPSSPPSTPMPGPTSVRHAGAGGQVAFADAVSRIGFAYLRNQMGGYRDAPARTLASGLRSVVGP